MTFDSNLAWKQASSAVAANREVLLALAGVFFLLPSLALSLLVPQPQSTPGMDSAAMMAMLREYYSAALPFFIPAALLQAAGSLAVLTLFTDRTRPTVGEAIRQGFAGMFPYFGALLLTGFVMGLLAIVVLSLGSVTGSRLVTAVLMFILFMLGAYAFIVTTLAAPVVAVERKRNPVSALTRAWQLARGNIWRIGIFYALVGLAFSIILIIVPAVIHILVTLVAGEETGVVITTVIAGAIGAVMTLYFVAISGAVHRQLAGPSVDAERATFD